MRNHFWIFQLFAAAVFLAATSPTATEGAEKTGLRAFADIQPTSQSDPVLLADRDGYVLSSAADQPPVSSAIRASLKPADPPTFGAAKIDDMVMIVGQSVNVTLQSATGGDGGLSYSLTGDLPHGLAFNEETRLLSGSPASAMLRRSFTYKAVDGNGAEAALNFSIEVQSDNVPSFPDTAKIDDMVFVLDELMSSPELPKADGGNGPLTYGFTEPLPSGLSFDGSTRVISGTANGTTVARPFAYIATDIQGDRTPQPLVFTISVESDVVPNFGGGIFIDQTYNDGVAIDTLRLPRAYSGNGALVYTVVGLPNGLVFDSVAVEITGTPQEAAPESEITYTATDVDGDKVSVTFMITVIAPPPGPLKLESNEILNQVYVLGQAIPKLQLPRATGGTGAISYSIAPLLPVGLSFSESDLTITGTPAELLEESNYTYSAEAGTERLQIRFSITIHNLPVSVPSFRRVTIEDQGFVVGQPITPLILPRAYYGFGELRYTITPSLPAQLSFDGGLRQISGTPMVELDSTEFAYTVTDASGTQVSLEFKIEIAADTAPSFAEVAADTLELVEGQTVESIILPAPVGGNGPLTYTISPELPKGLELDSTSRALTGAPEASAAETVYTYKATDTEGDADSLDIVLSVAAWTRLHALNSVSGQPVDMYLNGMRVLDDLTHGSRGPLVLGAGERALTITHSEADNDQDPLLSSSINLMPHHVYYVMVYNDGSQLQLAVKEDSETPSVVGNQVAVFVAHGSAGLEDVSVRIVDPRDNATVVYQLASNLALGGFSGYLTIGAANHNVEVVAAADGRQIEVYRFSLARLRNHTVALMLSSEYGLVGINQLGQLVQASIITTAEGTETLPDKPLMLDGNYPNPFNPVTRIQFHLGEPARVSVIVMDLLGRKVLSLPEQNLKAGSNQHIDVSMGHLASGLYLYRVQATMETGVHFKTGRMTLSK